MIIAFLFLIVSSAKLAPYIFYTSGAKVLLKTGQHNCFVRNTWVLQKRKVGKIHFILGGHVTCFSHTHRLLFHWHHIIIAASGRKKMKKGAKWKLTFSVVYVPIFLLNENEVNDVNNFVNAPWYWSRVSLTVAKSSGNLIESLFSRNPVT